MRTLSATEIGAMIRLARCLPQGDERRRHFLGVLRQQARATPVISGRAKGIYQKVLSEVVAETRQRFEKKGLNPERVTPETFPHLLHDGDASEKRSAGIAWSRALDRRGLSNIDLDFNLDWVMSGSDTGTAVMMHNWLKAQGVSGTRTRTEEAPTSAQLKDKSKYELWFNLQYLLSQAYRRGEPVTLYRGVQKAEGPLQAREATSWSTSRAKAAEFAGLSGKVLKMTVPASQVLMHLPNAHDEVIVSGVHGMHAEDDGAGSEGRENHFSVYDAM